jgi:acetylornithine deacetylase/succinyl-diaminopimelate desuccinylase-like protein
MSPMRGLLCAAAIAAVGVFATSAAPAAEKPDPTKAAAAASLPEYVEFLKIPNVTRRSTAEIRDNAVWLEAAFRKHGFSSRQLPDGDTPMVFAEWPGASPKRKTVLFYAHMDGQAVRDSEWFQPSPFTPVLKQGQPDGAWKTLPIEGLYAKDLDPELRVFARSASDDKAPIMMLMAAMDAMKAAGKAPAINVKIIIDSHEEGGKPTLIDVVKANAALLAADAVVMLDGPMHFSNKPTLVFGHRSGASFNLTVYGAKGELHSGHYGNYSPDPADKLARLISSFKDADGKVVIPGFYDGVDLSALKSVLAAVPDDEASMFKRLGIAKRDAVGDNYQESLNYPSLTIVGMASGDVGANRRTAIPATAMASFDARTVPATPGARQIELVKKHIEAQGYHLVTADPTDEERARYPNIARVDSGAGAAEGRALNTPLDAPVGKWARQALLAAFGEEPVRIVMMGGSVPSGPLIDGLGKPVLLIPLVNADNNQHAANENMRMGNYFAGVRTLYALFSQPLL